MQPRDCSAVGLKLVAGELCLDFANTADWHASDVPVERLRTYQDLVAWSRCAGLLDAAGSERLIREARRRPAAAAAVLQRAVAIREVIYGIVVALLQGRPPARSVLDSFNRELESALQHMRVALGPQGLIWDWEVGPRDLEAMLWPILRSAADLLTSERQERIGQCADDRGCGWLFLDTTKNRSRRWCEMEDCGNRAKAHRHYHRIRGQGVPGRKALSRRKQRLAGRGA
jgi:predicted RNA-binding Zn ribbon-like protein